MPEFVAFQNVVILDLYWVFAIYPVVVLQYYDSVNCEFQLYSLSTLGSLVFFQVIAQFFTLPNFASCSKFS